MGASFLQYWSHNSVQHRTLHICLRDIQCLETWKQDDAGKLQRPSMPNTGGWSIDWLYQEGAGKCPMHGGVGAYMEFCQAEEEKWITTTGKVENADVITLTSVCSRGLLPGEAGKSALLSVLQEWRIADSPFWRTGGCIFLFETQTVAFILLDMYQMHPLYPGNYTCRHLLCWHAEKLLMAWGSLT